MKTFEHDGCTYIGDLNTEAARFLEINAELLETGQITCEDDYQFYQYCSEYLAELITD